MAHLLYKVWHNKISDTVWHKSVAQLFLPNTLYSIIQDWGKKTEITLAEFWDVCKYYFIYNMFVIKLCEINFVYKAMYII